MPTGAAVCGLHAAFRIHCDKHAQQEIAEPAHSRGEQASAEPAAWAADHAPHRPARCHTRSKAPRIPPQLHEEQKYVNNKHKPDWVSPPHAARCSAHCRSGPEPRKACHDSLQRPASRRAASPASSACAHRSSPAPSACCLCNSRLMRTMRLHAFPVKRRKLYAKLGVLRSGQVLLQQGLSLQS